MAPITTLLPSKHSTLEISKATDSPVDSGEQDVEEGSLAAMLTEICRRWRRVAILRTILVLVVISIALLIKLITSRSAAESPVTTKSPLYVFRMENTTDMTFDERITQQEKDVRALPACQLVDESVKVMDVLQMDEMDEVLEGEVENYNIRVTRCRGLCNGSHCCLPSRVTNGTFLVKYKDENGALQYAERVVQHHLQCQCKEA